ncbi:MAG TPA: hypothetical protein DD415_01635 [Clostridiales bacterium]|nr:hypothetical protein [Clostridiales bacterium]
MNDYFDYEKTSYGKFAYKRVQRLRRRGKRRGIDVPYLSYELTKPEKPRMIFIILTIASAVLLAGIIIGIGFLYNYFIKSVTIFDGIGDLFKAVFDPAAFALSAGLSAIPALMVVVAYILLFTLFLLPLGAVIYLYRFVRDVFYMANCSKEEFAKGNIISSRITGLIFAVITATVIFIALLIFMEEPNARLLAGLIYGGILVVLGGLLAVMMIEKTRCGKWFEEIDEFKKSNYLEHERALRRVKGRLKTEKHFFQNLGK